MTMPVDLVLVRHGQSEGNLVIMQLEKQGLPVPEAYYKKHTAHWRLTSKGIEQAKMAGQWLRNNLDPDFDRYYVSDYVRAKETAAYLGLEQAMWGINLYLAERNWGIMDRFTGEQRNKEFQVDLETKMIHPFYWTPPRGESMVQLCVRLEKILETLHRECSDGRIIMVCHGEVMWGFRVILERIPPDKYVKLDHSKDPFDRIHNCQILHYSRMDPEKGQLASTLNWVRSICPTDLTLSSNKWREIVRAKFSNEQLLRFADRFPREIDSSE